MRVRKETGDFSIKLTNGAATIPKNLSTEDLLGYIVEDGSDKTVITSISATSEGASFVVGDTTYTYTASTGAVAESE